MAYGDLKTLISRSAEVARTENQQDSADGVSAVDTQKPVVAPTSSRAGGDGKARVWCEVTCMVFAVVVLGLLVLNLLRQMN